MSTNQIEKILKALANKRRLAIIKFLSKNESACVVEITKEIRISFKSTSKHLEKLKAADIVNSEYRKSNNYYRLGSTDTPFIKEVLKLL